jgi:DNA-binding IclR family transcriptional regulator
MRHWGDNWVLRYTLRMPKTVNETELASGAQLLDRAVAVLNFVGQAARSGGASIADISEGLNLKQPTAHRIAVALERHRLIDRDSLTKRYRLGLGLFVLGVRAADESGLRTLAQPALTRIGAATGDTVFLMARSGVSAICVDRHQGSYMIDSLTGGIGGQIPLGVGSASLAILASLPPPEADAIIEANSPLYPQHHGLTAGRVRSLLPAIRQEGYALDRGDLVAGISAFAVAISPGQRPSGVAIAVNMTSARLSQDRFEQLLPLVRREVQQLEEQINPLEIMFRQRPAR